MLLLLLFDGAPSLVGLGPLESGDEGVGERRVVVVMVVDRRSGGGGIRAGKAVESDVEAELKSAALEGRNMISSSSSSRSSKWRWWRRIKAGGSEERGGAVARRGEESGGDVERSEVGMASSSGEGEGVLKHRRSLRREGLL